MTPIWGGDEEEKMTKGRGTMVRFLFCPGEGDRY